MENSCPCCWGVTSVSWAMPGSPTRLPLTSCPWPPPAWQPQGPHVPTSRGMRRPSTTCGGAGGRREMAFLVAPDLKATRCVLAPVGPPAPCPGEGVGGLGAWGAEGSEGATDKPPERGRTIHSAAGRGRPPTTSSISGAQREAACLCVFFHESLLTKQSHRGL